MIDIAGNLPHPLRQAAGAASGAARRPFLRSFAGAAAIAGAACAMWLGAAGGAAQADSKTTPQKPAQTPAVVEDATPDPFTAHAAQFGVKSCAATYAAFGKMLTGATQYAVQTQTAKTDPNHHALQGIVGMTFQSSADSAYSGPAAGVVFAAPVGQGCEGNMVRVVPFQQDCATAATFLPKGSQPLQPLADIAVYALATGGEAMLMPSGNACVVLSILHSGT